MDQIRERNFLVTGSHGFVGQHLIEKLQSLDANVIKVDLKNNIDITKWDQIKFLLDSKYDIDTIIHLAAIVFIPYAFKNPRITYNVNIHGTLNSLEVARKKDVDKFVFASTYVYGKPEYLPLDEKHPVKPSNPYTHSKIIGEELCKMYNELYNIKCVSLRPFNIYGRGQDINFLIPHIISQLQSGHIKLKNPNPLRDYIYISDVINAYIKASVYKSHDFKTFNIGSGKSHSVKEIADLIVKLSKKDVAIEYENEKRKNEIMNTVADITKAKKELGWRPKIGIENGLLELLNI